MVLRSGIIIPFQFRDTKKLLMIGVPEENRNLNIWDLKNVVRAAFGIYNFEFRNKKIGFNIPDELLLYYLAQRHDLTNFVIEISQALDDGHAKELLSYEPSCSMAALKQHHQPHPSHQHPAAHHPHPHPHPHPHQHQHQLHVPLPQRSNESASHHAHEYVSSSQPNSPAVVLSNESVDNDLLEPPQGNNSGTEPGADGGQKLRLSQNYAERTPESLTQSIDPMDIIPKAESESEVERLQRASRFLARQEQQQQQQQHQAAQQQQQQQQPQHQQQLLPGQQIFPSYTHTHTLPPMNAPNPSQQQQSPYTPGLMSRFRMYDDNYVLNRQCRCSDQKMLNDSPTPEEPTNLCQPSSVLEAAAAAAPTPIMALASCDDEEHDHDHDHDHEHEHEESMKYRIDKASSGAASAELGMPAYEACSPKMDYDTQDELPDSPHSQPLPPPPLPLTAALPLPPPPHPTSHHQHLQQQQQQHEEEQQQLLQERIQHEYMIQQQQQHQHLQQQQQQHLALLQQQQQEQQQQQQQHQQHQQHHHQQQQQGVNMAMGTTTTNNIRQRKERMSKRQKELYVHFLQQHQFINDHRRNDPVLDPYWLKLANLLNAVPQGAVKHVTEWKQTFDNWRYRIFLYARYNSKLQDEEAQNPRNFKPLTRTDKQAYIMWIRNPDTAPPDLDKMRNVFCNLEETAVAAAAAQQQE